MHGVATFAPDRAECQVLVFREGLLSVAAHDLLLRATAFSLEIADDRASVKAEIDARSLRVVHAMRDGRELPGALSASDRQDIEATIRGAVLRTDRFPAIRFTSTGVTGRVDGWELRGDVELCGAARGVVILVHRGGGRLEAEVRLHQPDFGIRPYRAMLGALRIRADVLVRASVRLDDGEES
jgi:polyisoprenoid-binding protein YceI